MVRTQILIWYNIFIVYFMDEGCSMNTTVTADIHSVQKHAAQLRAESFLYIIRIRVNLKVITLD